MPQQSSEACRLNAKPCSAEPGVSVPLLMLIVFKHVPENTEHKPGNMDSGQNTICFISDTQNILSFKLIERGKTTFDVAVTRCCCSELGSLKQLSDSSFLHTFTVCSSWFMTELIKSNGKLPRHLAKNEDLQDVAHLLGRLRLGVTWRNSPLGQPGLCIDCIGRVLTILFESFF